MQTLREFFRQTYRPLKLTGRTEKNDRQYGIQIRHFARYLAREPTLADFSDDTLARFLGWFLDQGKAAATVNKARNHLLALWRLAAEKRIVAEFPSVRAVDEPERIPEAWTVAQLIRLFNACRCVQGRIGGVQANLWWLAIHRVFFDTGERTSATLDMRWDWVDLDTGWLVVPAGVRKFRRKPMSYQLGPEAVAAVRLIRSPVRELIFPWDGDRSQFWPAYGRLLVSAGLPNRSCDKPQKMRRSFASHLEAAGGNATEALGHSFRRTTTKSYLDPRVVGRNAHAKLLPKIDVDPPPSLE